MAVIDDDCFLVHVYYRQVLQREFATSKISIVRRELFREIFRPCKTDPFETQLCVEFLFRLLKVKFLKNKFHSKSNDVYYLIEIDGYRECLLPLKSL